MDFGRISDDAGKKAAAEKERRERLSPEERKAEDDAREAEARERQAKSKAKAEIKRAQQQVADRLKTLRLELKATQGKQGANSDEWRAIREEIQRQEGVLAELQLAEQDLERPGDDSGALSAEELVHRIASARAAERDEEIARQAATSEVAHKEAIEERVVDLLDELGQKQLEFSERGGSAMQTLLATVVSAIVVANFYILVRASAPTPTAAIFATASIGACAWVTTRFLRHYATVSSNHATHARQALGASAVDDEHRHDSLREWSESRLDMEDAKVTLVGESVWWTFGALLLVLAAVWSDTFDVLLSWLLQ